MCSLFSCINYLVLGEPRKYPYPHWQNVYHDPPPPPSTLASEISKHISLHIGIIISILLVVNTRLVLRACSTYHLQKWCHFYMINPDICRYEVTKEVLVKNICMLLANQNWDNDTGQCKKIRYIMCITILFKGLLFHYVQLKRGREVICRKLIYIFTKDLNLHLFFNTRDFAGQNCST